MIHRAIKFYPHFFLMLGFLIYGYFKSRLGIDFTDDGAYASIARHFAIDGRHDLNITFRFFDFILLPIFRLWPDIDLLSLRRINFFLHASTYVYAFHFFSKRYSSGIAAPCVVLVFFANNFLNIMSPGYNSISSDFLLIGIIALVSTFSQSLVRVRIFVNFFSGFMLGCASISYFSLFAIPVVIFFLLFVFKNTLNRSWRELFVPLFMGVSLPALLLCLDFFLFRDFSAIRGYRSLFLSFYSTSKFKVFTEIIYFLWHDHRPAVALLAIVTLGYLVNKFLAKTSYLVKLSFVFFGLLGMGLELLMNRGDSGVFVVLLPYSFLFAFIYFFGELAVGATKNLRFVENIFLIGIGFSAIWINILTTYYFNPIRSLLAGLQGLAPLFLGACIPLFSEIKIFNLPRQLGLSRLLFSSIVIIGLWFISIILGFSAFVSVYRDESVAKLTTEFSIPPLKGIYSSYERVTVVEALYNKMMPLLSPNNRLLAFDECPLIIFLLRAEPATATSWISSFQGPRVNAYFLDEMQRSGRSPRYVIWAKCGITSSDWSKCQKVEPNLAYESFLEQQYERFLDIPPFEIWQSRILF